MTDLRKIAERFNRDRTTMDFSEKQADIDIATLLDVLVEERAIHLATQHSLEHIWSESEKCCIKYNWAKQDWHTRALRELDLDGVWPMKEGE